MSDDKPFTDREKQILWEKARVESRARRLERRVAAHRRRITRLIDAMRDKNHALERVLDHDLDNPRFSYDPSNLRIVIESMRSCALVGLPTYDGDRHGPYTKTGK